MAGDGPIEVRKKDVMRLLNSARGSVSWLPARRMYAYQDLPRECAAGKLDRHVYEFYNSWYTRCSLGLHFREPLLLQY